MAKFCPRCGTEISENDFYCSNCGNSNSDSKIITNNSNSGKSKIAAGLLGIFLGGWGVHNFYLGFTGKGIAQIFVTIFTCGIGAIWGFIEGIMILTGSINTDADGNPLIN